MNSSLGNRPELTGTFGAVSSTHWLATAAGMRALERGGNAFDAVTAAGFVLLVVEPHSNGLGGDLCAVVHTAACGPKVVCGQGPMPEAATIAHFDSLGLNAIPGSGLLPATVPGAFGAWLRLLAEFGTMPLSAVAGPAIDYACNGYPLLPEAAKAIAALAPLYRSEWTGSATAYLSGGSVPAPGAVVRNVQLGETLARLVREAESTPGTRDVQLERAHRAFYEGFVAEQIDAFVRTTEVLDATGTRHRGLLTGGDMAAWSPTVDEPALLESRGYVVAKPGLWSQGPVFLQQLALLDGGDVASLGLSTAAYIHTVTEAVKLAMADREAWYGDADTGVVTVEELLDSAYTSERRALIGDRAAAAPPAGTPGGRTSWLPEPKPQLERDHDSPWMEQLQSGIPNVVLRATVKSGDTCTASAIDRWGNIAATVPSGGWLKSSPVIPGLGFALGTRGQAMWLERGHPNSLVPGRRPRTTLSPTVVLRDDGSAHLAFGTPGGDRQDQWTLQSYLAITEFGLDLQAGTEVTAFHNDEVPASFSPRAFRRGVVSVEATCEPEELDGLRARGHEVEVVPAWSAGKVCIVGAGAGGTVRAGAGPRGRQAHAACR